MLTRLAVALAERPRLRLGALVGVVAVLFAIVAALAPHSPAALQAEVAGAGAWGPLLFVAAWGLLTVAMFNGVVLAAASGLLFGPVLGTGVSIAGAAVGAALAYGIARRAGRGPLEQLGGPRLRALSRRVERRGFLASMYLRIAPGVPVTWLNYAAGLSRVRLRDFIAGSTPGGAPRWFAYTALGGSLGDLLSPIGAAAEATLALVSLLGLALAWRQGLRPPTRAQLRDTLRFARRGLRRLVVRASRPRPAAAPRSVSTPSA